MRFVEVEVSSVIDEGVFTTRNLNVSSCVWVMGSTKRFNVIIFNDASMIEVRKSRARGAAVKARSREREGKA